MAQMDFSPFHFVMVGPGPTIHVFHRTSGGTWVPRSNPGMTRDERKCRIESER